MSDSGRSAEMPPDALESVEGVQRRSDETLKEFVERVGDEADVDSELLDDAIEYVTEWRYANTTPADDQPFRRFLVQVGAEGIELRDDTESEPDAASTGG